jgi:hypothetical protein
VAQASLASLALHRGLGYSASVGSRENSFSLGPISIIAPDAPQPQAYCATLKYFLQHRFSSPVPLIKRQRSLTEAVLIPLGLTIESPKTLKHR